jgi:hypothetical protein
MELKLLRKLVFVLLLFPFSLLSQKSITNQKLVWYGYYNTLKINEKWIVTTEVQERQFVNPTAQHQLLFTGNLVRSFNKNWNASLGITYFLQSPNEPESKSNLIVPEWRPDVTIANKMKFPFVTISNRFKTEVRFFHEVQNNQLVGGYPFSNCRLRYQLGFDFPLLKDKITKENYLSIKVSDEIFFNLTNKNVPNLFDQNRIYCGANYKLNKSLSVEVGYLNWFQKRGSSSNYFNRDILRLSLFHTIDLNKKK